MTFTNYRLTHTHDVVACLDDSLRAAFGGEAVFRDKTGIDGAMRVSPPARHQSGP